MPAPPRIQRSASGRSARLFLLLPALAVCPSWSHGRGAAQVPDSTMQLFGTYQIRPGHYLVVGMPSSGRLVCLETKTGLIRALLPGPGDGYRVAELTSAFTRFAPDTTKPLGVMRPERGPNGSITGVRWHLTGSPEVRAARLALYRSEEVRFQNGDITLAGTLLVPNRAGRHPGVVLIHGSGPAPRSGFYSFYLYHAEAFARNGIAALVYDKRGSGLSTGTYENWF